MKTIFIQSYWFWVISKIILIILLLISTLSILGAGRLRAEEFALNLLGLIEAILLIITLFQDFSSNSNLNILKIITGILLTLFGIGLFIVLLTISKGGQSDLYFLGFPFAIWMILIGVFDLLRINKTSAN
jgi:hypothetical protein